MIFIKSYIQRKGKMTFPHLHCYRKGKLSQANSVQLKNFVKNCFDWKKLQIKLHPTNRDYSYYLKTLNLNSFFASQASPEEVIIIIQDLKTSKSNGPNSLPQKIIKHVKKAISLPLSE